jgi:hypothetical protein
VYRTIILDVMFGFETWSLSLRLEHREGVQSQGAKEDNYSLRGKKQHETSENDLCCSPNIV